MRESSALHMRVSWHICVLGQYGFFLFELEANEGDQQRWAQMTTLTKVSPTGSKQRHYAESTPLAMRASCAERTLQAMQRSCGYPRTRDCKSARLERCSGDAGAQRS